MNDRPNTIEEIATEYASRIDGAIARALEAHIGPFSSVSLEGRLRRFRHYLWAPGRWRYFIDGVPFLDTLELASGGRLEFKAVAVPPPPLFKPPAVAG